MIARSSLALATFLTIASSAAAAADARYDVHGPVRVRLTSGLDYEKTIDPKMQAIASGEGKEVRIDLRSDDRKPCTLRGKREGSIISLPAGQVCPQDELNGVLVSGRATIVGNQLTLVTHWNVEGEVRVLFRKVHVKGTVDASLSGPRAK